MRKEAVVGDKFRFKNGDEVSPWLLAEGLREAARSKIVTAESHVQKAGRDDWVPAASIPGLIPVAQVRVEPEVRDESHTPPPELVRTVDHRPAGRPPESIHHLLHRALHMQVQVSAHGGEHHGDRFIPGMIVGLTVEGVMVEFADYSAVVYLPLARIRSVVISTTFPGLGPPRRGEVVRIDVDSLPDMSELSSGSHPQQHSSHASKPPSQAAV